ncbi:growth hormone secretagogue receptor type 1 [Cricetulus griseus]|uniref:Growth hormone secretagogue receptor type 1 n=1 Tax=Cricetulus griseus TaxID=10029 RepID=G3H6H3_CRIGR|nr:growth hormone secretagogue receptor type 1 [Cricetulus griseus]XP_027247884.1 growth hormone secretagogue receptor type 1 [Cricetulus griseus]EGW00007.1 Growth hormone secretagogue receptor type 1 [Cricetulus griseus]ERE92384.1 growth hormone secretagogue receptor type 1 [Cricetulus griseus]
MWNATPSEELEPNVTRDLDWDASPGNDSLTDELLPLFPAPLLAGVTATCVALFVVGISGNLLTMLVVSRFRELRTTTNLYLSSMAFSDLLIFLCMPLDLVRLWQYRPWNFGDLLCKLFQFVSESCTYATVLTITALSVERYFAICFPLRAKVVVTKGRVKLVILVIWAVAFCSAGPIFVLVGVEHENGTDPRDTNECRATEFAVRSGLLTVMVWVSSVFFFLPVFCLTVLYSLIGRKLWRRRGDAAVGASLRDQNHKQTVKMLAVVVFAFILCWLPFHVGRYLFSKSFEPGSLEIAQISQYCNLVSFVLFYLSAAINPILYNIMSKKYRVAVFKLLGFESFSQRKLSTLKDESSRAWTKSSINT